MQIRPIAESDAEMFIQLLVRIDSETKFMLFEPGERGTDVEQQRRRIQALKTASREETFIADAGGELTGFLGIRGFDFRRNHHAASLVIGVARAWQRQGIGTQLLAAAEGWAKAREIVRLEFTVVTQNTPAIGLYLKAGFQFEGVRRRSLQIEGLPADEYYMAKLLGQSV